MDTEITEFFEVFPWNSNLETGITLIDDQHKQLVGILNKLAAHLADRSNPITLNKIFNELLVTRAICQGKIQPQPLAREIA